MKKVLMSTLFLAATSAFAQPTPTPSPSPAPSGSLVGTWEVTSRSCTSQTQINDGIKIGQDKIQVTHNADKTFEYKVTISGCETVVKGTYSQDDMKVTYTSATSQGCKETSPTPMVDTSTMFVAYLSDTEAVTVTTGPKAAMSCPVGDALVMHLTKSGNGSSPTP